LPIAALRCELIRSVAVTVIPRHILGMDKEIDKGLAAFIATLQGPFGQIPFERAVVRHLPLFLGLRLRGLTWTGIASLLTARGVRRANGHPISVEQLRGVISRQMRRSRISGSDRIELIGMAGEGKVSRQPLLAPTQRRSEHQASTKHRSRAGIQLIDKASSAAERISGIRAFMSRAARVRGNFDDAD
jgi:hypothetical protein